MKKIILSLMLVTGLMASPMLEQEAMALFESIKKSEYKWALAQWKDEMHIKTRSRASSRQSTWADKEHLKDPFEKRIHDPLRELPNTATPVVNPSVDPVTVPDI